MQQQGQDANAHQLGPQGQDCTAQYYAFTVDVTLAPPLGMHSYKIDQDWEGSDGWADRLS